MFITDKLLNQYIGIIYRNKRGLISPRNKKIVSYILKNYSIDFKCCFLGKYFYNLNIICKSFISSLTSQSEIIREAKL